MDRLVCETKLYSLSTRGSSCNILNNDPNYKSRCEYSIPNMLTVDDDVEYINFSIPYAVIPVSFYGINSYNNTLIVILADGTNTTYTFPNGNYTANYFMATFLSLLGSNWGISLNSTTNIFSVTNSVISFTFSINSTIEAVLGFNTTISSTTVSAPFTLAMSRCCNFLPMPRITMRCQEIASGSLVGYGMTSDVLVTIPNNSPSNGQLYYQNQTQEKTLYKGGSLDRFVVSITDDDGNLINFNGVSCFFAFQFDIYRKYVPKTARFNDIVSMVSRNPSL